MTAQGFMRLRLPEGAGASVSPRLIGLDGRVVAAIPWEHAMNEPADTDGLVCVCALTGRRWEGMEFYVREEWLSEVSERVEAWALPLWEDFFGREDYPEEPGRVTRPTDMEMEPEDIAVVADYALHVVSRGSLTREEAIREAEGWAEATIAEMQRDGFTPSDKGEWVSFFFGILIGKRSLAD